MIAGSQRLTRANGKTAATNFMKVGIVGVGRVGGAAALNMALRDSCRELVLIDADDQLAVSQALDISQTSALVSGPRVRAGDYQDLVGAEVVVLAPGINEKAGGADKPGDKAGRLRLLDTNDPIFRDVVPKVIVAAPDAVLLVATNPLDPMTELTQRLAIGKAVLGTGTFLDSLRFKTALADYLNVAPECVSALVLGEHGLSSVLLWSKVTIGGVSLESYLAGRGLAERAFRKSVEEYVRQGNINVIKGKGASEFAIGTVIARVVEIILRDECMVIPVSAYSRKYEVTLSLPRRVGRKGVLNEFEIEVNKEEQEGIGNSVEALKVAMKRLERSQ
jgi:L-lactate dehydrogenase